MNTTLIEYFAAHETLADTHLTSPEQLKPYAELLAGPRPSAGIEAMEWDAKWRAKLRFIRAKAMAEEAERIRAESPCMSPEQQRQTEEIGRLFSEKSRGMNKTTNLSFGEALEAMKKGSRVKRPGMRWFMLEPDGTLMGLEDGWNEPYKAILQGCDILANDWQIVEEA